MKQISVRAALLVALIGVSVGWALGAAGGSIPARVQETREDWTGKTWVDVAERVGFPELFDGDLESYTVISPGQRETVAATGLEWKQDRAVSGLRVNFAGLHGVFFEPLPDHQSLEYLGDGGWQPLAAKVRIDYRDHAEIAPFQKVGTTTWDFSFPSVAARGLRLVMSRTPSSVSWEQHYVVQELSPRFEAGVVTSHPARVQILGAPPDHDYPENLLSTRYSPRRAWDGSGGVIEWQRPKLIDQVEIAAADLPGPIEWWDGQAWRAISLDRISRMPTGDRIEVRFAPLAVKRLRFPGLPAESVTHLQLGAGGESYFESAYRSGKDLLMERLIAGPDLALARSLLLPLDLQTAVIGRPGDPVECHVHWDGTLVEIENGAKGAWNTGAKESPKGKEEWIDRWFAFAVGSLLLGEDPEGVERSYLEQYMPGVVTRHKRDGVEVVIEAFTTAPGDERYGQAVQVRLSSERNDTVSVPFTLIMGRRKSAVAGHQRGPEGEPATPMNFFPLPTGYSIDGGGRVVRNSRNEVVLFAAPQGVWGGNERERTLTYPLRLAAGETRTLIFFMPSVNQPMTEAAAAESFEFAVSRGKFVDFWREILDSRARIDLPEPDLNDLRRNLLSQVFMTLIDGETLKYGSYWYEAYFGLEEGWPIVALAQYGHAAVAERLLEIMLSEELLDESNYHHQYRKGLAPMYAAQTFRLTRNRAWLERIKPRLVETARWIMKSRHETQGKSAEFAGLLPKHAYGGDISTPAYSLYSNATCWRGLHDVGVLIRELGDAALAEEFLADARSYRERILELAEKALDRDSKPPFLPLAWEIGTPGKEGYKQAESAYPFIPEDPLGNYWILFAPLLLETGVFPADSRQNHWVTDFMEQRGGLLAGLARFHRGIDHIYGFGYPLQLFRRDQREKFLATTYALLAHGHSSDSFTGPEVGGIFPLRTDNASYLEEFRRYVWQWDLYARGWNHGDFGYSIGSEPLSAAAGVGLQLIRALLVDERLDDNMEGQGVLDILRMAPSHWLEDGKQIRVERLPTHFGEVSLELQSALASRRITVDLSLSAGGSPPTAVLWFHTPTGQAIQRVSVNGKPWTSFAEHSVTLPAASGSNTVIVEF